MTDDTFKRALRFLRGHTTGDLQFEEHLRPLKYIITRDGRPVAPVMAAMLETFDAVLYIPEYGEGCMEVQITLDPFKEAQNGEAVDRWRIYHGDPQDIYWAYLDIDAARFEDMVIDGEALKAPNTLADDEGRICKHMNHDHVEDMIVLAKHFSDADVRKPVMVGIDPDGFDIRREFDVVRVNATEPIESAEDARRILTSMTHTARGAGTHSP